MPTVKVDPPPINMSIVDPRTGRPSRPFIEFIHRLWQRTGGDQDLVTGNDSQRFQSVLNLEQGDEQNTPYSFPADYPDQTEVITAQSDFTTTGRQVVICTNTSDITVTLNPKPDDGEMVTIKRTKGGVFVSGKIDGTNGKRINNRYSAPHMVYTLAAGEWSIV